MAKVFLDANVFIDMANQRRPINVNAFSDYDVFLSPLSVHIACYIGKKTVPDLELNRLLVNVNLVDITDHITNQALAGPTSDFEDNIQLQSAALANCDYFLTADKQLLAMKFFGRMTVVSETSEIAR